MHGWPHNFFSAESLWSLARSGLDVLVVAYLIYRLMMLAKGTRAWQIISGLLVFGLILWLSDRMQLSALNWILTKLFVLGPVAIVILFYPELRRALEEVGRLGFWGRGFTGLNKEDLSEMIGEVVRAASALSDKRTGALIVLERETGLTPIVETGTLLNALVTADLLQTLFQPGAPLHDGAAVIRLKRLVAAGCILPLSENRSLGTQVHTRHKAALGISEQSDALVLVVSEETGIISLAFEGKMVRGLRDEFLRDRLIEMFLGRVGPTARRRRGRVGRTVHAVPVSVAARVGDEPEREKPTPPVRSG